MTGRRMILIALTAIGVLGVLSLNDSQSSAEIPDHLVYEHGIDRVTVPVGIQEEALLDRIAQRTAALDRLDQVADPFERSQLRSEFERDIRASEARLISGDIRPLTFDMPFVHVGENSVYWSTFTYRNDFSATSDPVSLFFWNEASAFTLRITMENFTRNDDGHRWEDAGAGCGGGANQWVAMKNSAGAPWTWTASNGANGNSLQTIGDTCFLDARHHVRTFHLNSDPDFGNWAVGAAHFESRTHTVQSWEDGEDRVEQSFRTFDNGPFIASWVKQIYTQPCNNFGVWQGVFNDGVCTALELD